MTQWRQGAAKGRVFMYSTIGRYDLIVHQNGTVQVYDNEEKGRWTQTLHLPHAYQIVKEHHA